jgi:two-component system, chemotaxis family, protein-glutamate methylesterase/glutaminase
MGNLRPLRVLLVDDSAANRRTIAGMLEGQPGVQVVGSARDGDEALRLALSLEPDLITLDLEMPKMDGFTFLRLLMASKPIPVVVISSHSAKDQVFRALELGAIDFIAKPDASIGSGANIDPLKRELDRVLEMVRQLSPAIMRERRMIGRAHASQPAGPRSGQPEPAAAVTPNRVVAIAASTGGPTALMELFAALPKTGTGTIVVAQHMPERFTRTFAERLDKQGSFRVREAEHGFECSPRGALVCPGGRAIEVERRDQRYMARVLRPSAIDRYAPSADRLFGSVARVCGERGVGVVMTGMGDDAAAGVVELKRAGGLVLAESEATAVVYGMPKVAVQTGCVDEVLPLPELIARIKEIVST